MVRIAHDGAQPGSHNSRAYSSVAIGLRAASQLLAIAILLAACNRSDQEIKVYRVAKAPLDSTPASDSGAPPDAASLSLLPGAVPSNWEPQPLSQMRQASFLVHGKDGAVVDISFVTLGPAAGNVLDNVNRWLSQLALPPVTSEALSGTVHQLTTGNGSIPFVDLTGEPENGDAKKDGRIIAAIASDARGTGFYKMRGNRELAGAEKENFLKWISSSRETDVSANPANAAPPTADSSIPQIKWEVPADWSSGGPSAMRYASFSAGSGDGKVDISVITFPGEGGGDLENVNRWRQQIGLPPVDASGLNTMITSMAANDVRFSVVDLAGASARTIAGWTRHEGRVWFLKLTGPTEAVEREKANFMKFIQSVRF